MGLLEQFDELDLAEAGARMHSLATELFPICRSITGNGIRRTLGCLQKHIALEIQEVPSGTQVFDWTVPKEWNIRDAYIKDSQGNRVVDFERSNLHVLNYSMPIRARMPLSELKPHLFTIPESPDWVPYRTSYYKENWGFCLSHNQMLAMPEGVYEVSIDSSLEDGSLTYGECFLPGETEDEVLISCHACHPSLANDNLSGVLVATWFAGFLRPEEASLFVPFFVFAGDDWRDHLAGAAPRASHADPAWVGADVHRGRRRISL